MMKEPSLLVFIADRFVDVFFVTDLIMNFMLSYRSPFTGGAIPVFVSLVGCASENTS